MNRTTRIEDLIDMEGLQYTPQSLDGHPPRLAENYEQQMSTELTERDGMAGPLRTKVRQHVNPRAGMSSGPPTPYPVHPGHPNHPSNPAPAHYPSHPGHPTHPNHPTHPGHPTHPTNPMHAQPAYSSQSNEYPSRESYSDELMTAEYAYGPRVRQARPELTCIQVAEHIKSCPICSKFYDTDKSTYIVIIGLLLILVVILLKRILESKSGSSSL